MGRGFFGGPQPPRHKFPRREKPVEVSPFAKSSSEGVELFSEAKRTEEELGFLHKSVERAGQLLSEATAKLRRVLNTCNAQNGGYRQALGSLVAKADVFRRGMLPLGNTIVNNLADLSRDYIYRTPEDFVDNLRVNLEKMRDYRDHAELAKLFYTEMAKDLEELKRGFGGTVESLKQTKAALEAEAEKTRKSRTWSEQLAILAPIVGVGAAFIVGTVGTLPAIATGITGFLGGLLGSNRANNYRIEEISLKANADIAQRSSFLIESGNILERILDFSKAMASIGNIFKMVEEDLIQSIGISGDVPKKSRHGIAALQERIRQHQNRHIKAMAQISASCRWYAVQASAAEINLQIIKNVCIKTNYVEDWFNNQKLHKNEKQKREGFSTENCRREHKFSGNSINSHIPSRLHKC